MTAPAPKPPAELPHDFAEAQHFLQRLDCLAKSFCFVTIDDVTLPDGSKRGDHRLLQTIHGSIFEVHEKLAALNRRGAGVYVTINRTAEGKRRKKANLERVRGVWADLDRGRPAEFRREPTMLVESSPGRYQAHWLTDPFVDDLTAEDHPAVMRSILAVHEGADPNAADLVRVMRLPGYWHQKRTPHLVRIVSAGPTYTRDQLVAAFPLIKITPRQKDERMRLHASDAPAHEVDERGAMVLQNYLDTAIDGELKTLSERQRVSVTTRRM